MIQTSPFLQMTGISKRFHGVQALQKVDFSAQLGQVTALVGENGAGKSTLMKILAGIHKRDEGEILLGGVPAKIDSPIAAMQQGISVIFVSSEMPEVLGIADRIIVMCDGRVTGELDIQDATQEKILELATRFENKLDV
jgi:ABC-type sugar transport system ATPase subunit